MKSLLPLAISASFLSVACGGDGGGGSWLSFTKRQADKFQDCGVLSEGQVGPSSEGGYPDEGPSATDRCFLNCIVAASCEEIEDGVCRDIVSPTLQACFDECEAQEPKFICADSGEEIPLDFECDGFDDCEDASDEVGCPVVPDFVCTDGQALPGSFECDGEIDCEGGEDEVNCPAQPEFNCADGSTVPASYECDSEADCADGSDETGCAVNTCPDEPTT